MGKYGGDLTNYGQTNSLVGKNIEAFYRGPKEEQQFANDLENFEEMSVAELQALIPANWHDDTSPDYWQDELVPFSGKDGQTNAYVKRGIDDEISEYGEREQTNKFTWKFMTDDNHIHFLAGAKIYTRGREWFLIKVITQDSTLTIQNKYNAMDTSPKNTRLLQMGLKTLVLV
jgi:hypothetical protein